MPEENEAALAERLRVAEQDTGYKLGTVIDYFRPPNTAAIRGTVAGFGRVNDPDGTVRRALIVRPGPEGGLHTVVDPTTKAAV